MKTVVAKSLARSVAPLFLNVAVLFCALQQAAAIIDVNLQMQLGNLSGATNDPNNHFHYLIKRTVEAIDYSDTNGCPNWASWDLTTTDTCCVARTDAYAQDTSLPSTFRKITNGTFGTVNGTSYDRGHMCPSADRLDTTADNTMVFLMSNMIVQDAKNNSGLWDAFENYCRTLLSTQELLIVCGPYNFSTNTAGASKVYIASNIFKVVVCAPLGTTNTALDRITNANPSSIRVIAIETPNDDSVSGHSWTNFITSTKQVQQDTGYNFFSALPTNLAWVLRSKVDGQTPVAPGITSFSPSSGTVGASVTITGPRLDTVTNVFFNGTVASYTITATNQIAATVPTGATSGSITAKGLGGTATSSSSFTVTTASNPAALSVSPAAGMTASGTVGGPFTPPNQVYTLSNTGSVAMDWTASNAANWLTTSATSGNLAGGGSTNISVSISPNANGLAAGSYSDTVSFTNVTNGAGNTTRSITLTVLTPFQTWQMQFFNCSDCSQAQPDADPLGKGMSNLSQFLAGLNPTNPASVLRITSVVTDESNNVLITWSTAGVRTNAVQVSVGDANGGYTTNFVDLTTAPHIIVPVSGDTTTNYLDVGGATNGPGRYYRIRLVP